MSATSARRSHPQLSLLEQERLARPRHSDADCVVAIADRLIAELDQRPPISLEVVASYRDIAEIKVVPLAQSGSLAPAGNHLVMRLSAADNLRRRRFTGFHEVGHTFQPGYREQTLFRCTPTSARQPSSDPEGLADVAAAVLLMPRRDFQPLTESAPFSISSVVGLADHFQASIQASAYRFSSFWPEPTMVVALELGKRKADRDQASVEPKLRVVSAAASAGWTAGFVPRNKSAILGGALERALTGEQVAEQVGLEELGLPAAAGRMELVAGKFRYWRGDELRDRVLAIYRQKGG